MSFGTYTVIAQLNIPVRAETKAEAIAKARGMFDTSETPLKTYAGVVDLFIPDDPDFNPDVVDRNAAMLDRD